MTPTPPATAPGVLVLGATGRVGARVVRRLRAAGLSPRCVARDPDAARHKLGADVDVQAGDLDAPAALAALLRPGDAVFLASPIEPAMQRRQCDAIDVLARQAGRIVKLSGSTWTQQSPATWSGAAHAAIERRLADSGVAGAAVRPGVFTEGFLIHGLARARDGDVLALPIGQARVAFADLDDIADVCTALLLRPQPYAGHVDVTVREAVDGPTLAQRASALTGRTLRFEDVPLERALAAQRARLGSFELDHVGQMLASIREGRASVAVGSLEPVTGVHVRSIDATLAARLCGPQESR